MSLSDKNNNYAEEVFNKLKTAGYRVEIDLRAESMGKKVREASIQRFNYIVTVGEEEEKNKSVAIKKRDGKEIDKMKLEEFIELLSNEIENKN